MTSKFVILIMTIGAAFAPQANAGGVSGGGGKGVVCRESDGKVKSVELLDLWEARNINGERIPITSEPVKDQVLSKIPALGKMYNARKWTTNGELEQNLRFLAEDFLRGSNVRYKKGIKLNLTPDSFEQIVPADCDVEQIAIYNSNPSNTVIFINADLYEKMDATNQAALVLHEVVYAHLRTHSRETDSLRARRIIGRVFAGKTFQLFSEILPQEYVQCESTMQGRYARVFITPTFTQGQVYHQISADWILGTALISPTLNNATGSANLTAFFDTMKSSQTCDNESFAFAMVGGNQAIDFESTVPLAPEQAFFMGRCEHGKHVAYITPRSVYYEAEAQSSVFLKHPDTREMRCEFIHN